MPSERLGVPIEEEQPANCALKIHVSSPTITALGDQEKSTALEHKDEMVNDMAIESDVRQDTEQTGYYSVFTVPQKRAIILSGSFLGLLSYMSSSIFYPAVNQARISTMFLSNF